MDDVRDIMEKLGYDGKWLDLGVVDAASLKTQHADFEREGGRSAEDFRFAAFVAFVKRKGRLDDAELDAALELPDRGVDLRGGRIIELISSGILSDAQLASIGARPEAQDDPVRRRHLRETLGRRLEKEGLTEEVFGEIMHSRDATLQRMIDARADVQRGHLEVLAREGANSAVRNSARQALNRRLPKA